MRILLADDHEIVRRGMRSLFAAHDGWEICAECANGREAVEKSVRLRPDVAVLDITMPELNGIDAARQILRERPRTATLIYTVHDTEPLVREVLMAGARGFVAKSASPLDLVCAVDAAHRQFPVLLTRSFDGLLRKMTEGAAAETQGELSLLTGRQRQIVQLLAEGKRNKEIARQLGTSLKTVEVHRARIMQKLKTGSAAGIVRYAIRNRLIDA